MKTQKKILFPLLLAALLLSAQHARALALTAENVDEASGATSEMPPSESPTCNLEATINTIQKNPTHPDYYDVNLEISGISDAEAGTADSCSDSYAEQIVKAGQIMKASDYLKQAVREGDNVQARVQFTGDGILTGYFLSGIRIINTSESKILDHSARTQPAAATASGQEAGKKNDSGKTLIGAFCLLTTLVLSGMIYSARDKTKF